MTDARPEALAALCARAYRHAPPWSAAAFAEALAQPATLLATAPGAFVLGRVVADEAEILALATDPAAQRQGAARAAFAAFEAEAHARGARTLFLEVAHDNTPALAFYASTGWTRAGQRRAYYPRPDGPAADALILTKPLS